MSHLDPTKRLIGGLPPMSRPPQGTRRSGMKGLGATNRVRDYTPVAWSEYFESCEDVACDGDVFRVYTCGQEGPVCLLLHGGGFSALSWACLARELTSLVRCRCVALDLRGHGDTRAGDDTDLSATTLATDVERVMQVLYGDTAPATILVGHSMGGAIAVQAAQLMSSCVGLAVIDVVEGTALDALSGMQGFLRSRPDHFLSLDHAIEWCVRSGHIRNIDSAKVSMVGQLKRIDSSEAASRDLAGPSTTYTPSTLSRSDSISEEAEDAEDPEQAHTDCPQSPAYTWRTDLAGTEPFWRGWFEGLSARFLAAPCNKLLLLAGVDRLDTSLTVAQMQGKFQMHVLPQAGHAVHEDAPEKVAEVLAQFMVRHRYATALDGLTPHLPAC